MAFRTTARGYRLVTFFLAAIGLIALAIADLGIYTGTPGKELARLGHGLLTPGFMHVDSVPVIVANTLAFAFQGVALGITGGLLLALAWQWRAVRAFSAVIRAVHELFWGLIFLQLFGLSAVTGILAIGLPYMGIFAKVFGEFFEEADPAPAAAAPTSTDALSRLFFTRLPLVWRHMRQYCAYRLECGIRASAILGFIGLPTLGFHLETALRQGYYSTGAGLLYLLLLVIVTLPWWLRLRLVPAYLFAAILWSPPVAPIRHDVWRVFMHDLVPAPWRHDAGPAMSTWLEQVLLQQALPGVGETLVLGCAALLVTGVLALLLTPLVSHGISHRHLRVPGHVLLVVLRSLPEFLLAFFLLVCLGPSMLPGILALALHTGAIVAHLNGRFSVTLPARADRARGLNGYLWEVVPRLYPNFLAFLLYRWEIIMRETAVLGIIGIHTLGFYIDSAFAEFRLDRAVLLIAVGVCLNLAVDALSRHLRARVRLSQSVQGPAHA